MQAILWAVLTFILREVVVKFTVFASIYAVLVLVVPMVVAQVAPFIGTSSLTSLFGAIPDGVYWFLYVFKFDVGLPLLISAHVAGFLIRRMPRA